MGIVLISFVSAGLLDIFGKVVEEVEVSGLVFYLDNEGIMGDDSFNLVLNDKSSLVGTSFTLEDGTNLAEEFYSESLGVTSFYPVEFEIVLDSEMIFDIDDVCGILCGNDLIPECVNMSTEDCLMACDEMDLQDLIDDFYLSGTIDVSLYLVNNMGQTEGLICNSLMLGVGERDEEDGYRVNCEDEDGVLLEIDNGDRLKLLLSDGSVIGIGTKTWIGESLIKMGVYDE